MFALTHELYLKLNRQITNSKKNLKPINSTAILVLENGTFFKGFGLGYEGVSTGEVCFNTAITGYQEIISDPSYAEQIINFTFPHIGNVGVNKEDNESENVWTKGVIFNFFFFTLITIFPQKKNIFLDDYISISYLPQNHVYKYLL